jgi:predicted ATP-dependent endonuclease of OLD family
MSDTPLRRVKSIKVSKLFGLYDHVVNLKLDDRVTILHGPNGVGKTVLLRMIHALFRGDFLLLKNIPFDEFVVTLTDATRVTLERPKPGKRKSEPAYFRLTLRHKKDAARSVDLDAAYLESMPGRSWEIEFKSEFFAQARFANEYFKSAHVSPRSPAIPDMQLTLPLQEELSRLLHEKLPDFQRMRDEMKIHLIETQRLLYRASPHASTSLTPTVREYARAFADRLETALAEYGRRSQILDQSFPQRLLKKPGREPELGALQRRMEALEQKQAHLKAIGLLDDTPQKDFNTAALEKLDKTERAVIALYVSDTEKKLGVLDDLARRVSILLDHVNTKFRHKRLRIHRDKGFEIVGDKGVPVDLESLSSGEQHELVLFYDLLFRVEPNTLVLIDEPELSLHVAWQKRFVADLLDIVKVANFDALLATHSPFIVGDRSDLMVALDAE